MNPFVGRRLYAQAVKAHEAMDLTCVHGQIAGDLVRPWTGTPACAFCRRNHPVRWKRLDAEKPLPRNVVPLHGDRKLW